MGESWKKKLERLRKIYIYVWSVPYGYTFLWYMLGKVHAW